MFKHLTITVVGKTMTNYESVFINLHQMRTIIPLLKLICR